MKRSKKLTLIGMAALALFSPAVTAQPAITSGSSARIACSPRMEYLLEGIFSTVAVPYFQCRYPLVTFTHHPTMNGFYAMGNRDELLAIKRELVAFEKTGETPPWPPLSPIALRHVTSRDAVAVLRHRVLGIECEDSLRDTVHLMGSPELRHKAALALKEIDRPSVWIKLPRAQLTLIPPSSCQLPPRGSNPAFTCPKGDCGGILHLLGLRSGDQIHQSEENELGRPMWVVTRNKSLMNIYVEFY